MWPVLLIPAELPHDAEYHDAVPTARADVRERAARAVECAEVRRIGRVVRRVRRIEAVVFVRVVDVEAKAEPQPFVNRPLLGERSLSPYDARGFEGVTAECSNRK